MFETINKHRCQNRPSVDVGNVEAVLLFWWDTDLIALRSAIASKNVDGVD